jgi:hypothetical protein
LFTLNLNYCQRSKYITIIVPIEVCDVDYKTVLLSIDRNKIIYIFCLQITNDLKRAEYIDSSNKIVFFD